GVCNKKLPDVLCETTSTYNPVLDCPHLALNIKGCKSKDSCIMTRAIFREGAYAIRDTLSKVRKGGRELGSCRSGLNNRAKGVSKTVIKNKGEVFWITLKNSPTDVWASRSYKSFPRRNDYDSC